MASSYPELEFALQDERLKRKIARKSSNNVAEVLRMMGVLRENDGNNTSMLASM